MDKLSESVVHFFRNQSFIILSTIDKNSRVHSSCKGIVKIRRDGSIYLLDLYKGKTYENIRRNPQISITAVDEHNFVGFCLKGRAKIVKTERLKSPILDIWEQKIADRIAQRLIRNIKGEKSHSQHPEALLPRPEYLIVMKVREVIDLTPQHIKQGN